MEGATFSRFNILPVVETKKMLTIIFVVSPPTLLFRRMILGDPHLPADISTTTVNGIASRLICCPLGAYCPELTTFPHPDGDNQLASTVIEPDPIAELPGSLNCAPCAKVEYPNTARNIAIVQRMTCLPIFLSLQNMGSKCQKESCCCE